MFPIKRTLITLLLSLAAVLVSGLTLRSTSQPLAHAQPIDEPRAPTVTSTVYLPLIRHAVGRPWPDTTDGIFVLNDQLATWNMTEAQVQFAATHYVGTQKVTRDQARHLRQYNPNFLALHYRLGQALGHSTPNACQPTTDYLQIIDGDQWVTEWPGDATVQESWFYHYPSAVDFRLILSEAQRSRRIPPDVPVTKHKRFAFYEVTRSPDTILVIATGEQRIYANIVLTIGVVMPE